MTELEAGARILAHTARRANRGIVVHQLEYTDVIEVDKRASPSIPAGGRAYFLFQAVFRGRPTPPILDCHLRVAAGVELQTALSPLVFAQAGDDHLGYESPTMHT